MERVFAGSSRAHAVGDVGGRGARRRRRLREELAAWLLYERVKHSPDELAAARAKLLAVPPEPSFAKRFPSFEGVCQGNRRTCSCGAPFFS